VRASFAGAAAIGGSAAVVFATSVLPLTLLLRVAHWFPAVDPRLVALAAQALGLALVFFVLRVPVGSLLRGLPPREGIKAGSWLTLGKFLFSLLATTSIASTSEFEGRSATAEILAGWARGFPLTGLAGHFAFYVVFVPVFEELLYRALILGHLLRHVPPWLALAGSTLLFAAGHQSWLLSGLSGFAYGLLYLRFRNLWLCVLFHSAHNLVSSAGATLLAACVHDMRLSMPLKMDPLALQFSWALLILACFVMFLRRVFAQLEGGPTVLLLGPRTAVNAGASG
jgi:membrane protease YdiL (CAAX protease family)